MYIVSVMRKEIREQNRYFFSEISSALVAKIQSAFIEATK
jgi:hypothetical protein